MVVPIQSGFGIDGGFCPQSFDCWEPVIGCKRWRILRHSHHRWQDCPLENQESQIDPWPWYFWKVSHYTSHLYRDAFAKVCDPLGRNQYIHHQFVSRYGSHLIRDALAEVLGSEVVRTPPRKGHRETFEKFGTVLQVPCSRFTVRSEGRRSSKKFLRNLSLA